MYLWNIINYQDYIIVFHLQKYIQIKVIQIVYKRIMSILSRIIILTIMYQIISIIWIFIAVFRAILTENEWIMSLSATTSGL